MITGGNASGGLGSNLYTPSGNAIATGTSNVADQRWYATMLTLPDGRPIILGGMVPYNEGMFNNPDLSVTQGLASMTPEVFENGAWRSLFGANSRDAFGPDFLRASYPRAWVTPSGRIFGVSTEKMWWLDPAGNGSVTTAGNFKTGPNANTIPNVGPTNSAVMYAPGKILIVGGNALHNGFGLPGSNMATAIDVNGAQPTLTEQPRMGFPRHFPNTIVLPDGKVLVTGGETRANNDPALGVFAAEIWNPATGTWQVGANARVFRGYHSSSALLPNGTVLSVGGGSPGPAQLKGEVYYPPYLFRTVNGAAQLAPRPIISAISSLSYTHGTNLEMDMANANTIAKVALIGLSSGTHSFNNGQRYVPITFKQQGTRITAMLPSNTLAPPGYYQVVAIDANGVPSKGTIIALGQGVNAPPVIQIPVTPPPVVSDVKAPIINAGGTATLTTTATAGAIYSWNFGDGSAATVFSTNPTVTHVYTKTGVYGVTLTTKAANGAVTTTSIAQGVANPARTPKAPSVSSAMALESKAGGAMNRLFVVNPDNNTVSVFNTATNARLAELPVGISPRSVAIAPDNRIWVSNKGDATLSILNATTGAVEQTVKLPPASQPHGLAFAPDGSAAYVVLEATGQLLKLNPANGAQLGAVTVGANVRQVSLAADKAGAMVSRFITPPLPGEATRLVDTSTTGAEVVVVNTATMAIANTIKLKHSDKVDNEIQGSGIPNYLGAAAISPDGKSAWVPSKQDNIKRGTLRNGQNLNFQNTVRAISSRIDLMTLTEDQALRIDHDNSSVGSAAAFHPTGVYLFVALESSRQVAVVDAAGGREILKVNVGRAPQALTVSPDGKTLYVQNFMDRSVSVLNLTDLVSLGQLRIPVAATLGSVANEKLPAEVLRGKQFFYDARDQRLARDSYMSCATCHNDGGQDGRVWDLTGFGEGLRNTIALNGRAGMGNGALHWSANFDEVQDFEVQIRLLAGGTGLMTDAQFNTGTRNQILGDKKTGVSADLDALAAYVGSLNSFANSPTRNADGTLNAAAIAGKTLFKQAKCDTCHGGAGFTNSRDASALSDIGTLKPTSGNRLNGALNGIDIPTLKDVWSTAPYLHDGSAHTLATAILAHRGVTLSTKDLSNMVAYIQSIDNVEPSPNGTVLVPPTTTVPASAVYCADEGGICNLPAGTTASIYYGTSTQFVVKQNQSGAVGCNNGTFTDPAHGIVKKCAFVANTATTPPPSTLAALANWKFDSAAGNVDSSGNGKTLTIGAGASITPAGRFGSALLTKGGDPSSAATSGPVLNTAGSFTVAAWVKLDNLTEWRTFVNQDGSNVSGFWLQYSQWVNNNKFVLTMHDVDSTASTAFRAVSTTTPVVGQWYHLVGVRDKAAGTMKIYVNGKLEGTTAYTGGWAANGNLNIGRGKWGGPADWVAGAIDEVSAYGRALTDAEIAAIFAAGGGATPPAPATITSKASVTLELNSTIKIKVTNNEPDLMIRHVNFGTRIDPINAASPALDRADSSFIVRAGRGNNQCYSFEAVNFPGFFLQHENFGIRLIQAQDNAISRNGTTFCAKTALSGLTGAMSFESLDWPGYFIRHINYNLEIAPVQADIMYSQSSSFYTQPVSNPLPIDATVKLQSANFPEQMIRHFNFEALLDPINAGSNFLDQVDSSFKLRRGRGNAGCYTFESVNLPGFYLQHENFGLRLIQGQNNAVSNDGSTFCARPALNGNPDSVSFESLDWPGYFIRHAFFNLGIGARENTPIYQQDASFNLLSGGK